MLNFLCRPVPQLRLGDTKISLHGRHKYRPVTMLKNTLPATLCTSGAYNCGTAVGYCYINYRPWGKSAKIACQTVFTSKLQSVGGLWRVTLVYTSRASHSICGNHILPRSNYVSKFVNFLSKDHHTEFYPHFLYNSCDNNECSVVKSHFSLQTAVTSVSDRIYEWNFQNRRWYLLTLPDEKYSKICLVIFWKF